MTEILKNILLNVQNPARYIGGEINTPTIDNNARVKFCMLSPELYEEGMNDLNFLTIYHKVNDRKGMSAERAFAPWLDMAVALKKNSLKLFSLENKKPLCEFDLLGASLKYVNDFTTLLFMLDLGGVKLEASTRGENEPLVFGIGDACINPEVTSSFLDFVIIGDAEDVILSVINCISSCKTSKLSRKETLLALSKLSSCYVPSVNYPVYNKKGILAGFSYDKVKKAVCMDLDRAYMPNILQVPNIKTQADSVKIEPIRGCTRGCRFCIHGFISRPVRERRVSILSSVANSGVTTTGYRLIESASECLGEYSKLGALLTELDDLCKEKNAKFMIPEFERSGEFSDFITLENPDTLKVTIEAGSAILRSKINKVLPEERIFEALELAFKSGYKNVKLYFMIGLPFETGSDLMGIVEIVKKVKKIYQKNKTTSKPLYLTCVISNFVPKPFTPFAYVECVKREEVEKRFNFIKKALKKYNTRAVLYSPLYSEVEAILSRGGRKVSDAVIKAYKYGAIFDRNKKFFNYSAYKKAFIDAGVDITIELAKRDMNAIMPWDNVDVFVSHEFLVREYEKAKSGIVTPDCRNGCENCGASLCGVCKHGNL